MTIVNKDGIKVFYWIVNVYIYIYKYIINNIINKCIQTISMGGGGGGLAPVKLIQLYIV